MTAVHSDSLNTSHSSNSHLDSYSECSYYYCFSFLWPTSKLLPTIIIHYYD